MVRVKIVFMIDAKPLVSNDAEFCTDYVAKQVRFSMLRILTYFGGKHRLSGRKESLGPLWGYKFYKSSGGNLDYGNHNFFDLTLKDFQRFEDELEEKLSNTKEAERSSLSASVADRFSCALAEVVAGFQWERPDFFSPVKSNRKAMRNGNLPMSNESEVSNFVFLFTPCPGCCGGTDYFPNGNPSSSTELQRALVKEEVSRRIINDCRISFNWIDMGKGLEKDTSAFHDMLGAMMYKFSGTLVPVWDLSFWWIEKEKNDVSKTMQPGSFGCFIESLLCPKIESENNSVSPKISIDTFNLLLSINGVCSLTEASLTEVYLPVTLRSATIKRMQIQSNKACHSTIEAAILNKKQCSDVELQSKIGNGQCNIGEITGVFKSSAALSLLQSCRESFYCSYDFSQSKNNYGGDPITTMMFQQLLKILKTKRLILVIKLNHPGTGCSTNACFQPWTSLSGILTIMEPLFSDKDITKYLGTQSMKNQLKLLQGHIKNIQAKLDSTKSVIGKHSVDAELMSDLKKQSVLSATSFMQSMDYWFMDLPSHALPPRLHHGISRMQNVDAGSFQNANQRSTALFKKLKDFYKEKQNSGKTKEPEKDDANLDDPISDRRNLKIRTFSRSALLIENSKAVKMQRKSEDDIKDIDKRAAGSQSERNAEQSSENEGCDSDNDGGDVFTDLLKHAPDLSSITLEDLISYMKNEILTVLSQDIISCQASAKRLSRNIVLSLNKVNENKGFEECILPAQFLEKVFREVASVTVADRSVKILSYILRVSMDLEIAVISKSVIKSPRDIKVMDANNLEEQKRNSTQGQTSDSININFSSDDDIERVNPVAERVLEQLRPLVFLQDPSFIAKHLNTAILPRFKSKIPHILREIYEGLGQPIPSDIQSPSQKDHDADDSFEVINDSIIVSDYGSNNPSNQSGPGFRRFVSASDCAALKRQIIIPAKTKSNANKRQKRGYLPEITRETKSGKEGWCRNLFETNLILDAKPPATGSRKRKISRPHSELAASVKDTPARKQKRHFFWKKQHKERRKTNGITDITVIGESPIKQYDDMESTYRISASSRLLSRSRSFSCKTSPRRFYAPRKSTKTDEDVQGFPGKKKFTRSLSCLPNTSSHSSVKTVANIGIDHDKVFYSNGNVPKLGTKVNLSPEQDRTCLVSTPRKRSLSIGTISLPATDLPISESLSFDNPIQPETTIPESNRTDSVIDVLDLANATNSFGFDANRISSKPLLYSEDSMDWVAMFGNDRQKRVESPLPTIDSVSSFRGSETDSLTGASPNPSTPIRDGKQPFSSPFLSASSLDTLENAPIISPRLRGSNPKRGLSCRKRIQIATDG